MQSKPEPKVAKSPPRAVGHGVGLRPPHYSYVLENRPKISWFEVISENYMGIDSGNGGRPIHILEKVRENYPIVLHGVSLSIGSVDPINEIYLKNLKELIDRIEPTWVSDHLCWTGVDGENLHDLLPLPYTQESIRHLVSRVLRVQEALGRRMLFENVSSYLTFETSEMTEWEFVREIAKRSGCGILLDVNNIYVSGVNHRFEPMDYINGIPVDIVGQFHLAGYSDLGTHLIDTHDHPVSDPVWTLYEKAVQRFGDIPTLIEWDDKLPSFPELLQQSRLAEEIQMKVLSRGNSQHARAF